MKSADGAQAGTGVTVAVGGGLLALEKMKDALKSLEQAGSLLERAGVLIGNLWPALLVLALGVMVWHLLERIKFARLEDARSNRNLAR